MEWVCTRFDGLTPQELHAVLRLRAEVFVVEQECPYLDPDDADAGAWHLMGRLDGGLVTYARWYPEDGMTRLGRIVSSPAVRGQGHGKAVVREALRRIGNEAVLILAQRYLERFYADLGFVTEGEPFLEDGIPHLRMVRPWLFP